jgi:uncharacterized protein YbgA (DUF1722 family)/uncharacterized protein YbbK (DUF523 family)
VAEPAWRATGRPIRIGASSCLLGSEVRWDGGRERSAFLTDTLDAFVDWVPVCPELELGLGVPRPPIQLVQPTGTRGEQAQRLEERDSGRSHTTRMRRYARRRVKELEPLRLCGYVLKKDSPSRGMERVKVWSEGEGPPHRDGRGFFARVLLDRMPLLPVEEEGRLNDPGLREAFVERIFAYDRLRALFERSWKVGDLVAFHTAHKMQLLAHDERRYRALGRVVAAAKGRPRAALRDAYGALFMEALGVRSTPRKHNNVLQHAMGHLRGWLDDASRGELVDSIEDYRRGLVPIVVPIALMRHHVRVQDVAYLADQVYLDPHPKELMLRNHV